MESLQATVIDILAVRFDLDPEAIQPSASLEDIGLDSLGQIELATTIQKKLGVSFTDDEIVELVTIADVVAILEEKGVAA